MKKKLVSLVLASCMVLSLAACGQSATSTETAPADTQATESAPADSANADAPAAEPVGEQVINVCF